MQTKSYSKGGLIDRLTGRTSSIRSVFPVENINTKPVGRIKPAASQWPAAASCLDASALTEL